MDINSKRLNHERAINKYTGELKEKNYNKCHNKKNLLQYQEITNQFDVESQLTTKRVIYFEKFSKLDVSIVSAPLFSLCALGTLVIYKVFAFSSSVLHYLLHKISFEAVEYHSWI